jgi:hypothetical protein
VLGEDRDSAVRKSEYTLTCNSALLHIRYVGSIFALTNVELEDQPRVCLHLICHAVVILGPSAFRVSVIKPSPRY